MSDGWIAFGIIVIFMVGAALPLLRKNHPSNTPPPTPKETLRDWRNEK
ncbi:hypothetical protein [Dechloromonas denitrificans]|nr:hypothetical protein [Dechloromonas denitrificans]UCV05305.1 hypothetical protein KI611_08675 [Dechloromonas denitrificans]UCV09651.1 hypothetical protein KI615_09105 [Dechloromonas denitrificans]